MSNEPAATAALTWKREDFATNILGQNWCLVATGTSGTEYRIQHHPAKGRRRESYQLAYSNPETVSFCGRGGSLDNAKAMAEREEASRLANLATSARSKARGLVPTLGNLAMSPADICRANGWGPGTRLRGEECGAFTTIEVTAVGLSAILATAGGDEGPWALHCRAWEEVPAAEAQAAASAA